jgi:hypothetical protein
VLTKLPTPTLPFRRPPSSLRLPTRNKEQELASRGCPLPREFIDMLYGAKPFLSTVACTDYHYEYFLDRRRQQYLQLCQLCAT